MGIDPKAATHPFGVRPGNAMRLYGPRELVEQIEALEAEGYIQLFSVFYPIGHPHPGHREKQALLDRCFNELRAWGIAEHVAGRLIMSGVVSKRDDEYAELLPIDPKADRIDVGAAQFSINRVSWRDDRAFFSLITPVPGRMETHYWELLDARVRKADDPLAGVSDEHRLGTPSTLRSSPARDGRPPKHNWAQIDTFVSGVLSAEGAPESGDGGQARLMRRIRDRFYLDGGGPVDSDLKDRVSSIIKAYRAAMGEAEK
jgi:hypothetical protein